MKTAPINEATPPHWASEEPTFGIRDVAAVLVDYWRLIVAVTAVFAGYGAYLAWVTPPQYQASALVEVETRSSGFALGPESFGAGTTFLSQPLATQIEILKSRSVLGEAVENLGLNVVARPRYWGRVGAAIARTHRGGLADPLLPLESLSRYAWGGEVIRVASVQIPEPFEGRTFVVTAGEDSGYTLTVPGVAGPFPGKVGQPLAVELPDSAPINLRISKLTARPGTEFVIVKQPLRGAADSLRSRLRFVERGDTGAMAASTVLLLLVSDDTPYGAADAANAVAQTYLRQNVERVSQQAEKKLEFLDQQLPMLRTQLQTAEDALLEHRARVGNLQLSESSEDLLGQMTQLQREIGKLELERSELSSLYTAQHPLLQSTDRKLAQLRSERERMTGLLGKVPDAEARLLQLTRDVDVTKTLYLTLLNNAQELRIAKAGTVGNVRIIDTALVPEGPYLPNRPQILIQWSMIGLLFAAALSFALRTLSSKIETPEQAEKKVGVPVYATIPHSGVQAEIDRGATTGSLLALSSPHEAAVEGLRSLRASMHFALLEASSKSVAITGPSPGVGKTFVASNLAVLMADTTRRTLLIDVDLRRGRVHEQFGIARSPGLSDVIASRCSANEAMREVIPGRLFVIPSGQLPPNPAELLGSERFVELIARTQEEFDIVIMDAPPVMNLADTLLIGRIAGATFVTVRGHKTNVAELERSVARLRQNGIQVDGLIFNDLRVSLGGYVRHGYGYYNYHYYRYDQASTGEPARKRGAAPVVDVPFGSADKRL